MDFKEEKKVFSSFLKGRGLKHTAQREEILKAFLSEERHFTAEDLYLLLKEKKPAIGFATVYRTLKLLCEANLASEVYLEGSRVRYEHKYRHEMHEHIVCVNCGKTIELKVPEMESLTKKIEKKYKFKLTEHRLKLFGKCEECRRDKNEE